MRRLKSCEGDRVCSKRTPKSNDGKCFCSALYWKPISFFSFLFFKGDPFAAAAPAAQPAQVLERFQAPPAAAAAAAAVIGGLPRLARPRVGLPGLPPGHPAVALVPGLLLLRPPVGPRSDCESGDAGRLRVGHAVPAQHREWLLEAALARRSEQLEQRRLKLERPHQRRRQHQRGREKGVLRRFGARTKPRRFFPRWKSSSRGRGPWEVEKQPAARRGRPFGPPPLPHAGSN